MLTAPSGTVTFLFTDIEGSTQLWENYPGQMRSALQHHDQLLQQAVMANRGYVVKTTGDGLVAAFHTANDALDAVLLAQQQLLAQQWPDSITLKVRMGLHTGTAEYRDGDYFGPTLNRATRLMAAGHGGQVLLSGVTQELCRDSLPADASLLFLGEHRLKDLNRPETIYQLLHPSLPSTFPPLRTLDNLGLPNNLPIETTSFIGREKEMIELRDLLGKTRLLTLTGAGGCGKTRLSLQVCADVLEEYPDGVWFVELAALSDQTLVPQAVTQALGVREQAGLPLQQTLTDYLKTRRLLLLLDNCEHLLPACAQLVTAILRSCPNVRIITTTRERLGIAGEMIYRVPSLSVPPPDETLTLENLSLFESVRLFIDRAVFHKPDFAVTNHSAPALAQLCHRLDGIPLAIELAAARVRSLSLENINNRLDQRFRLLTGGDRAALPRQQTLRALVDWSYELLSDLEKILLARLSVFAGGWMQEAAESVCGFPPIKDWEVLDLLTGLSDKSLILAEPMEEGTRYRMLETIRQYGSERLQTSGEEETVRALHGNYFVSFAEEAGPGMLGADQAFWLSRLDKEHDNLRTVLEADAIRAQSGDQKAIERGVRLAAALWRFWDICGYWSEGTERLRAALEGASTLRTVPVADALSGAGALLYRQGDYPAAFSLFEKSLVLFREREDKVGMARVLGNLGSIAGRRADYQTALTLFRESLDLFRESGNKHGMATTLNNMGLAAQSVGDHAVTLSLFEQSLNIFRELGNKIGMANVLCNMGTEAQDCGDNEQALSFHQQSLALHREAGNIVGVANALNDVAFLATARGDFPLAFSLHQESLTLHEELGDKYGIANALEGLASAYLSQSAAQKAATLWGAASALREAIDGPIPPVEVAEQERELAEARVLLGDAGFSSAWAAGRALSLPDVVSYAREAATTPS